MYDFDIIETPENVNLQRRLAGIGSRFLAGLLDTLLLALVYLVLYVILVLTHLSAYIVHPSRGDTAGTVVFAVMILIGTFIYWGYFIVYEMWRNGQTPGKRWLKIRVVQQEGAAVPQDYLPGDQQQRRRIGRHVIQRRQIVDDGLLAVDAPFLAHREMRNGVPADEDTIGIASVPLDVLEGPGDNASWLGTFLPLALLLGCLASPTDRSATLAVTHQYKAKGPVTSTILGVTAFDDVLGMLAVTFGMARLAGADELLATMTMGVVVVNFNARRDAGCVSSDRQDGGGRHRRNPGPGRGERETLRRRRTDPTGRHRRGIGAVDEAGPGVFRNRRHRDQRRNRSHGRPRADRPDRVQDGYQSRR